MIDVFDYIPAEDFLDEPQAEVSDMREVAAYSVYDGIGYYRYDAPEYRSVPLRLQLQKGLKTAPFVDNGEGFTFSEDIVEEITEFGEEGYSLEDADIVTSLNTLRMLLAYVDGSMTEDFRSKGLNQRRYNDAANVDLCRVARMPEAPKAVALGSVWSWVPENMSGSGGNFNNRSYDVSFAQESTGRAWNGGPPSTRHDTGPLHFRILEFKVGGLKVVVRVPVVATVPAEDMEVLADVGQGVSIETANRRDAGELWSYSLATRFAYMKLGNVGMLARGLVNMGSLIELQELTLEDLELDRPEAVQEASRLLGRLVGLLRRVKQVADCSGCKERKMWLQYYDAELRIISPRLSDEEYDALHGFGEDDDDDDDDDSVDPKQPAPEPMVV